ncbi:MAG: MltA domain-containing protein [Pseudomonadota bacterium]
MKKSKLVIILSALLCILFFFIYNFSILDKENLYSVSEIFQPAFNDDSDIKGLEEALKRQVEYFEKVDLKNTPQIDHPAFSPEKIKETINKFYNFILSKPTSDDFNKFIKDNFKVYKAKGSGIFQKILFTGYYTPLIKGSLKKTSKYIHPIYRLPKDIVSAELRSFSKNLEKKTIRGKVLDNRLVPYLTRQEIDQKLMLAGKQLEMLWTDNYIDLFFLQIQGSGIIELENNKQVNIGYAGVNGRPYVSIGKLLIEDNKISTENMSMQAIKQYFKNNPDDLEHYLYQNESYVFFKELSKDEFPKGSLNIPLVANRSIAADPNVFPKGCLAYIETEKPIFDDNGNIIKWEKFGSFVIDQDSGGAIKGSARIDIFFGKGETAQTTAGYFKQKGKMFYFSVN